MPDVYAFQLWNANADDLRFNLQCLAGTPAAGNPVCRLSTDNSNTQRHVTPSSAGCNPGPCDTIQAGQMVVTEFGTGSSADNIVGNGTLAYGDADTPTSSKDGQQKWLGATLCVIGNMPTAYFGLYDSATFWVKNQYPVSPASLAWLGYWGLAPENASGRAWAAPQFSSKASWPTMASYLSNSLACGAVPAPVIALQSDASEYNLGETAKVFYTAGNVNALTLNDRNLASKSCEAGRPDYNRNLSSTSIVGSCGFVEFEIVDFTQTNFTLKPTDDSGIVRTDAQISIPITVRSGPPQVTRVANRANQSLTIGIYDEITIDGIGFSLTGGNTVVLTGPPPTQPIVVTENSNQTLGLDFWDFSATLINVQLGSATSGRSLVVPGQWTVSVINPANPGLASAAMPFSISQ